MDLTMGDLSRSFGMTGGKGWRHPTTNVILSIAKDLLKSNSACSVPIKRLTFFSNAPHTRLTICASHQIIPLK